MLLSGELPQRLAVVVDLLLHQRHEAVARDVRVATGRKAQSRRNGEAEQQVPQLSVVMAHDDRASQSNDGEDGYSNLEPTTPHDLTLDCEECLDIRGAHQTLRKPPVAASLHRPTTVWDTVDSPFCRNKIITATRATRCRC